MFRHITPCKTIPYGPSDITRLLPLLVASDGAAAASRHSQNLGLLRRLGGGTTQDLGVLPLAVVHHLELSRRYLTS
jgi:hypothetical protein